MWTSSAEHKLRMPCDLPEALAVHRLCGGLGLPVLRELAADEHTYRDIVADNARRLLQLPD